MLCANLYLVGSKSINIKRNNIFNTNIESYAWDLYTQYIFEQYGNELRTKQNDFCTIFEIPHHEIWGSVYGIQNRNKKKIKVTLDFSMNIGCYFSPWNGIVQKIIKPESIWYLCSWVEDGNIPINDRRKFFDYTVTIE